MGTVYLDEKNAVRFDPSPDAEAAKRAYWNRHVLDMADLTIRYLSKIDELLLLQGRLPGDTAAYRHLDDIKQAVWARSIATAIPFETA